MYGIEHFAKEGKNRENITEKADVLRHWLPAGMPVGMLAALWLIQLPLVAWERQQRMRQVLGTLHPEARPERSS